MNFAYKLSCRIMLQIRLLIGIGKTDLYGAISFDQSENYFARRLPFRIKSEFEISGNVGQNRVSFPSIS